MWIRLNIVCEFMEEVWLYTDEREDLLASLRMVSRSCDIVRTEISAWKWIVIGTHSALQSAMAFHLGFGNDLLVAKQVDATDWLQAHEDGTPYPEMMMDWFLSLYKKLKRHEVLGYKFTASGKQDSSIKRLNWYRNEFVHFMPKGWSIELSGMPAICLDCLGIIDQLDQNSPCMRWESDDQQQAFRQIIQQCQFNLEVLKSEYIR